MDICAMSCSRKPLGMQSSDCAGLDIFGAVLNAIRSCVSHSLSELGPARGTLTPGKACTCQAPPACLQLCRRRNCHVVRSVQVQYAVCSNAEGSNGSGGSGGRGRGRGAGCGLPAAASAAQTHAGAVSAGCLLL